MSKSVLASGVKGTLTMTIHRAKELHNVELIGSMHPYVELWTIGEKFKTKACKDTVWEQSFIFNLNGTEDVVHIRVRDSRHLSDTIIGRADIPLRALAVNEAKWYTVVHPDNFAKSAGSLLITTNHQAPGVLGAIAPLPSAAPVPASAPVSAPAFAQPAPPPAFAAPPTVQVLYLPPAFAAAAVAAVSPQFAPAGFGAAAIDQMNFGGDSGMGISSGLGMSAGGSSMGMGMGMGMGMPRSAHFGAHAAVNLDWQQLPGSASRVGCAHKGHLMATRSSGEIYEMRDGRSWTRIEGIAKQVSIGSDGDVWAVTANGEVYHRVMNAWTQTLGDAVTLISVGNKDHIVCVRSDGSLYQWNGMEWKQLASTDASISWAAIGHDGDLWCVNASGAIYHRVNGSLELVDGTAQQVAVHDKHHVFVVTSEGGIYQRVADSWVAMLGNVAFFEVGRGLAVAANSAGNLYMAAF